MNRKTIYLLSLLLLLTSARLQSQEVKGTLTIHITNFHHNKGKAIVKLFREEDSIPKKPFIQICSEINDGRATIIVDTLPYGYYAAIAFHDENSNGELDHSWEFPSEPIGFSNGWKLSLFSGMPNFKKLKFEFSQQILKYEIQLR